MTEQLQAGEIAAIRDRHLKLVSSDWPVPTCYRCEGDWPCDADRLLATVARQAEEIVALTRTSNQSIERMRIAEYCWSELQKDVDAQAEQIERLQRVVEKIASSGNVHPSWLIADAKAALEAGR